MTAIGLVHPGAMGAAIGATLRGGGHEVSWAAEGRSDATVARAAAVGLTEVRGLSDLIERCDVILSICPPAAAGEVAGEVAALGFAGVFVDANAVSPGTARDIGAVVEQPGATFVDGGIIGPPPGGGLSTLLSLSGEPSATRDVADLFDGSDVNTSVVGEAAGAASATKMAFAAWTKGSSALLLATRALAEREGVADGLDQAWAALLPDLPARLAGTAAGTGPKAWRFEGEMREIAATFEAAGLPGGFHEAAADIYGRLSDLRDASDVSLTDVIDRLAR